MRKGNVSMNKKMLSLLIAGFLLTGIGFNAASYAAPHRDNGVRKEVRHQGPQRGDFRKQTPQKRHHQDLRKHNDRKNFHADKARKDNNRDFRAKRDNSRFDSHKEHKKDVKKFQKNQKKDIKNFKKQQKNVHKAPNKRPQARNHRPARRR